MSNPTSFAVTFLIQSVLILGFAVVGAKLFRGPEARLTVLRYAFLAVVAVAAIRAVAPGISNPWLVPKPKSATASRVPDRTLKPDFVAEPQSAAANPTLASAQRIPSNPLPSFPSEAKPIRFEPVPMLLAIWGLGCAILIFRVAVGIAWIRKLGRTSTPIGYSRTGELLVELCAKYKVRLVAVAESTMIAGPIVTGYIHPTIYLPAGQSFDEAEMEAVLGHELAHVRGNDCIWALATHLFGAILWPNLFVWIAGRQMNLASEERCDLAVLQSGAKATAYAECLLRIADSNTKSGMAGVLTVGMFSSSKHLSTRITMLFNSARQRQKSLPVRGRMQVAFVIATIAAASCLAVPTPIGALRLPLMGKSVGHAGTFQPSKKELDKIRATGLPYISGDFTLVYKIVSHDDRTDAQRKAEYEAGLLVYKKDVDAAVKSGKMTPAVAADCIKRFVLLPKEPRSESKVLISCRNGLVLYKQTGAMVNLLTRNHVYTAWSQQGNVSEGLEILNWYDMPLPAAGFAHFPLSFAAKPSAGSTAEVPDLPYYAAVNGVHDKWEGGITSDLLRRPATIEYVGSGPTRRMTRISHVSRFEFPRLVEYEFHRFIPFKGIQIASDFTRFWGGSNHDFILESASPAPLPESEFIPGMVLRGKHIRIPYKGRNVDFVAYANGTDFQTQLDEQVIVADKEAAKMKQILAHDAYLETIPGGAPDIMPLYKAALTKAGEEGKVVVAISTASNCPPCHMLQRMLKDPVIKSIADKHYEILWIDCGELEAGKKFENVNGEKLCKQLNIWTGFPSYAAVDQSGNVIVASGSVGYPDDKEGDEKFFKVFNPGGALLTQAEVTTIQTYLNTHRE